jgi:peptide/nickel transport system permease protein
MRTWRRFFAHWQGWLGLLIVGSFISVALLAPLIAPPSDPDNPSDFKVMGRKTDMIPHPPNGQSPLGTASRQIDIFYSVVWGTRAALRFGLTVAVSAAVIGVLAGAFSGYAGGWGSAATMHVTDAFLAFPVIAGVWLFRLVLSPPTADAQPMPLLQFLADANFTPLMVGLIAFSWMPYARLINVGIARLKTADFVLASQSLGASRHRVIFRHLLPNALTPAIVLLARDIGGMVILEAAFVFIGLGSGGPWAQMLVNGRNWIVGIAGNPLTYWWVYLPPTVALILFGIGWNLLGDGLNDALNPREY